MRALLAAAVLWAAAAFSTFASEPTHVTPTVSPSPSPSPRIESFCPEGAAACAAPAASPAPRGLPPVTTQRSTLKTIGYVLAPVGTGTHLLHQCGE